MTFYILFIKSWFLNAKVPKIETDDEFNETYSLLSNLEVSYLHVFTYSERENTFAIELNPKVEFSDGFSVDSKEMKTVQERAHRYCFIANSLSDEVKVKIN